jgi:CheY-like chemotaxis protein
LSERDAAVPNSEWRGHGTVLIADDVDQIREAFRTLLVKHGFRVLDVPDGVAAIQAFHAFGRDIIAVLMDHLMPHLGGPEACEAIRTMAPDVPILSVSPLSLDDINHFYRPGLITGHVELPVRLEELLRAVRRVMIA